MDPGARWRRLGEVMHRGSELQVMRARLKHRRALGDAARAAHATVRGPRSRVDVGRRAATPSGVAGPGVPGGTPGPAMSHLGGEQGFARSETPRCARVVSFELPLSTRGGPRNG